MSERTHRTSPFGGRTFQLEDIPQIDPDRFEPVERAAIERAVTRREQLVADLQSDVVELQNERETIQRRVSTLESERDRLRERLREIDTSRPSMDPRTVFSNFGSALDDVRTDLAGSAYTIDDVDIRLKANVTVADEEVRMHLPSLDETWATENLSEFSFRLSAEPTVDDTEETDYVEIPDLTGVDRESAARTLASVGLEVGEVGTVEDPDAEPGRVLDQFPEPQSVAEPETPVDLDVSEAPVVDTDSTEDTVAELDVDVELLDLFRPAIEGTELDDEAELAERLREAGIDDIDSLTRSEPETVADLLGVPVDRVVPLHERLVERRSPIELERIDGIGPTYGSRLREEGVRSVEELVALEPETVADITQAAEERVERWFEQAQSLLEN